MGQWIDVCDVADLIPNAGVCALVEEKQVALFYETEGDIVYAINNYDPFSHINVLSRGLMGDIKGTPMVSSPIYKQHFNLKTGQCFEDETVSVESYSARVVKDRVEVNLDGDAQ